jgi:hypothetical protein
MEDRTMVLRNLEVSLADKEGGVFSSASLPTEEEWLNIEADNFHAYFKKLKDRRVLATIDDIKSGATSVFKGRVTYLRVYRPPSSFPVATPVDTDFDGVEDHEDECWWQTPPLCGGLNPEGWTLNGDGCAEKPSQ